MKETLIALAVSLAGLSLASCDKQATDPERAANAAMLEEQKPRALFEKYNATAKISALFYGTDIPGGEQLHPSQLIAYIVLKDKNTGQAVTYDPPESDTRHTVDFFFPDIWSPDGTYIVLPLDKFNGFAIFNSKTAIQDIKSHNYADTIRVWRGEARRYWHSFEAWQGQDAFYFTGEMEGEKFRFKYDIPTAQLFCFDVLCGRLNRGKNMKQELLPQAQKFPLEPGDEQVTPDSPIDRQPRRSD